MKIRHHICSPNASNQKAFNLTLYFKFDWMVLDKINAQKFYDGKAMPDTTHGQSLAHLLQLLAGLLKIKIVVVQQKNLVPPPTRIHRKFKMSENVHGPRPNVSGLGLLR